MKAIKIDVVNKTISEVEINDYKEIYGVIGNGCHTFCCPVSFDNEDTIFCDDESLLQDEVEGCFIMEDWSYPLVGNAVILGIDEEGESVDYKSNIEDIKSKIIFGSKEIANDYKNHAMSQPPVIYMAK
jgi:hypothetical protein